MGETSRSARSRGGVVTFLFTDLVASTALAGRLGEDGAEELRQVHFALLRKAIGDCSGEEVKNLGDGIMATFTSPADAAEAAVTIQTAIAEHNAAGPGRALSVRIGLHAGEPVREDGDYFGTVVVVAARLCAAARGGQILAGEMVAGLVGNRGGYTFAPVGRLDLKGLSDPLPAVELLWSAAHPPVPASRTAAPQRPRRSAPRGPDLVGRAAELAELEAAYDLARTDGFRCVLLCADPGVGKTRLAGELLARHAQDATVLQSRAHPMAAGVAFGVWAEALDPLLQVLGDDEVAELCGGFLDDLSGLFHRVAALRGPWSLGPAGQEAPRPRLLAGLARIVDELCAQAPTIVLLDDVHWADASSWEVLRQLARRLIDAPLFVVLTARPSELAEHEVAAAVLYELEQDGLLSRVDLTPLQDSGLRELAQQVVGTAPTAALVDWLSMRSRGNALFALGLLRALIEEGADLAAPVLRRLPEGLTERVAARVRNAPPNQLAILDLLAVAGRPVPLGDLVLLAEQSLDELSPTLTDLVATRGVVENERGRSLTYEISHPLVRDALYEQIGGARRRVLHRRAARVLRDAGRIGEAAGHYARSAEPGDPEAVAALVDALREAEEREAASEALTVLGALVDLLPAADARWLDVLDAMRERAEWITDHRADSHPAVTVAALRAIDAQLSAEAPPARRALVKFRLAHFLAWGTGDAEEADALCRDARDLYLEAGDPGQARVADREYAHILAVLGRYAAGQEHAESLAAAAERDGDDTGALLAWSAVVPIASIRGRYAAAVAANDRVEVLARHHAKAYRQTVATNMAAMLAGVEGRVGAALVLFEEAKRHGPANRETIHLDVAAITLAVGGHYRPAARIAAESAELWPVPRRRRLAGMVAGALAAAEMSDAATAQRHLSRAATVLAGRDWQCYLPLTRWAEALSGRSAGGASECVAMLRGAAEGMLAQEALLWAAPVLLDLAEMAAELGGSPDVGWAAGELRSIAGVVDRPPHHAMAAGAAAWSAWAAGDVDGALDAARRAVAHAEATDWFALHGRCLHVLGLALSRSEPAQAVTALQESAGLLDRAGAVWRRQRVLEDLRALGSSGRRALAAALGPDSLTPRERDVARLAAQGQTAKEIGAALFVGERTVETHLRNAYAKLGVDSKLDLVRRAADLGLS